MDIVNITTNKRKAKDRIINLRISQLEEERLRKEAEKRGTSLSQLIREGFLENL